MNTGMSTPSAIALIAFPNRENGVIATEATSPVKPTVFTMAFHRPSLQNPV